MRSTRAALAAIVVSVAGCLSPPVVPPRADAGTRDVGMDAWLPAFAVLSVTLIDGRGTAWPLDAAPRTPSIEVTFSSPPSDPSLILLVDGDADADLVSD